jgi:hypothetical protein
MYYKKKPSKKQVQALLDMYSQSCDEMRHPTNATSDKNANVGVGTTQPRREGFLKKCDKQKRSSDFVAK